MTSMLTQRKLLFIVCLLMHREKLWIELRVVSSSSRNLLNFKNIAKTLVKKHQAQLAFHFENFYFQRLQFGPISEVLVSSIALYI